jgi:hypothetical protein
MRPLEGFCWKSEGGWVGIAQDVGDSFDALEFVRQRFDGLKIPTAGTEGEMRVFYGRKNKFYSCAQSVTGKCTAQKQLARFHSMLPKSATLRLLNT